MDADTLRVGIKFHALNIETLRGEVHELLGKIEENQKIIVAAYGALLELLPYGLVPPYTLEIGTWECPPILSHWERKNESLVKRYEARWSQEELERIRTDNPIGVCIYDVADDPCRDFCLFCGHSGVVRETTHEAALKSEEIPK